MIRAVWTNRLSISEISPHPLVSESRSQHSTPAASTPDDKRRPERASMADAPSLPPSLAAWDEQELGPKSSIAGQAGDQRFCYDVERCWAWSMRSWESVVAATRRLGTDEGACQLSLEATTPGSQTRSTRLIIEQKRCVRQPKPGLRATCDGGRRPDLGWALDRRAGRHAPADPVSSLGGVQAGKGAGGSFRS
jgi:hypothetical protein